MIMRTFPGLLTVALTLSACATGSYDPQTVTETRGAAHSLRSWPSVKSKPSHPNSI